MPNAISNKNNKRKRANKKINRFFLLCSPYFIAALLVCPFALCKVENVEIRGELQLEHLSFSLQKNVTNFLNLENLRTVDFYMIEFSRFDSIKVPYNKIKFNNEKTINANNSNSAQPEIEIIPKASWSNIIFRNVKINQLSLKTGSKVTLSVLSKFPSTEVQLKIDECLPEIILSTVKDSTVIKYDNCELEYSNYILHDEKGPSQLTVQNMEPELIRIRNQKDDSSMVINIELPGLTNIKDGDFITDKARFFKPLSEKPSSVLDGRISFINFNKDDIPIYPKTPIQIGANDIIHILEIGIENKTIKLAFEGPVSKLMINKKDYIPTLLQWILDREPLVLFLNITILIGVHPTNAYLD